MCIRDSRWSSSSVGRVVEFSSSVVGSFSHRRVSVGDGLSCVVKCESGVCVREHEGFPHVPYLTAVFVWFGVVCGVVVEVGLSEGCVDDDDKENDVFLKRCIKRWLRKGGVNTLFPAESLFQKVGLVPFWRIFLYCFLSQGIKHQSSISASRG